MFTFGWAHRGLLLYKEIVMPLKGTPKQKVSQEMKKFKEGDLHSGSKKGPVVTNPKQAIAISLSEAGLSKKKKKKKLKKK